MKINIDDENISTLALAIEAFEILGERFSKQTAGDAFAAHRERMRGVVGDTIAAGALDSLTCESAVELFRLSNMHYTAFIEFLLVNFHEIGVDGQYTNLLIQKARPALTESSRGLHLLAVGAAEVHDALRPDCDCSVFDDWVTHWMEDRAEHFGVWEEIEARIGEVNS